MLDLDRRRLLTLAAIVPLAAALPAWAVKAAEGDTVAAAWDLTDIYPSDAAWDAARKQALAALPGLAKYKGHLGDSAATLAEALTTQSDLARTISRSIPFLT